MTAAANPSTSSSSASNFAYGFRVHQLKDAMKPQPPSPNSKKSNKNRNNKNKRNQNQNQNNQNESVQQMSEEQQREELPIECLSVSNSILLDAQHLKAGIANSLHDLQCNTGTFILQAFLEYPNLRRVFGISAKKKSFQFAHKNAMSLVKNGYENRKFILVENIPGTKITLAEKASVADNANKSFKVGEMVIAFIPLKSGTNKRSNYSGIVTGINKDGIHFSVQMAATKKTMPKVHRQVIFKPSCARTFEICKGNLFERADSFRADIICLPFSISNDSFKSLLLTGCKRSFIAARLLSYQQLEYWDGFPEYTLRRIDANVYDNDRFETNKSAFTKLYLYENVQSPFLASSMKTIDRNVRVGSCVNIRDESSQHWFTADVLSYSASRRSFSVSKHKFVAHAREEEIQMDEQRVQVIRHRFKQSQMVCAFCPKKQTERHEDMYNLFRAQIIRCNRDGTYVVQYEDGEIHEHVYEVWVFAPPRYRFKEGQVCHATRFDLVERAVRDTFALQPKHGKQARSVLSEKCVVRHRNPDSTYRVEFYKPATSFLCHDHFCEAWLARVTDVTEYDAVLPLCYEIDYNRVPLWKPSMVAHWLHRCGLARRVCEVLRRNGINGVFLFDLELHLLVHEMALPKTDSLMILKFVRALKTEVRFTSNQEEEQMAQINEKIESLRARLKELSESKSKIIGSLESLYMSNKEAKSLHEYEQKLKCVELHGRMMSKKDIAHRLERSQKWVAKHWNLDAKKLKKQKPSGKVVSQIEQMNVKAKSIDVHLQKLQEQVQDENHRLIQFYG